VSASWQCRVINRLVHGASSEHSGLQRTYPLPGNIDVFFFNITAKTGAAMLECRNHRASHAHVRIQNRISRFGKRQHQPFHQFYRKLTGMDGFFNVIVFDIGEYPHIARVFAQRITGQLPYLVSFKIFFVRIF